MNMNNEVWCIYLETDLGHMNDDSHTTVWDTVNLDTASILYQRVCPECRGPDCWQMKDDWVVSCDICVIRWELVQNQIDIVIVSIDS